MSAGLMSCVRENSPPLDMDDMGAISLPSPETPETQKRRRFHPLRNLRRMFRRRTVVTHSATSSPNSTIDQRQQKHHITSSDERFNVNVINSNTLPSTLSGSTSVGGVGGGFYLKDKRDHSADSIIRSNNNNNNNNNNTINSNNTNNHHHHHNTNNNSSCDIDIDLMNDYQRSLSEGRLINSDYSRDALSQSHDSVFSESATASSLSIVLKAELADALRKRRNRPNNNNQINASDEDIAFAGSPNKHTNNIINNQSEGSSSLLSMTTSSDLDEESSSGLGGPSTNAIGYGGLNNTINSTFSSTRMSSSSQENSKYSDEIDLDLAFTMISSTQLSHAAAKHKMAIRPKKKGPSRPRRHIEKVLETFPEDNEESMRFNSSDIKNIATKLKSQSLPPGMNVKMLEKHSNSTMSSSMSSASSSSSSSTSAVKTSSISSTFTATTKSMITSKTLTGSVSATALRQQSEQLIVGGTTTTTTINKHQEKIDDVLKESNTTSAVTNNTSTTNTAPTTEHKEEAGVGFLQRLLNRSINKKKKSITLDSTDNIIINNVYNDIDATPISDHKRMDASGAYVHQGPIIANDKQTLTAINKTSFIADDNKKLDSLLTATKPISMTTTTMTATTTTTTVASTGIRKEPAIIIETKPYDQSSLNTYLPIVGTNTDQRINNTKSTQKIEKPIRSGPASRQRVLPQELSLSPQAERKISTTNSANEDASPIKTPVTPGASSNLTTPTTPNTPKTPPVLNKQTLDFIEQEKLPTTNLGTKSPTKPKTDIKFGSYLPKLITGTTTIQSVNLNSDNNKNNNESTTISKSEQTNLNDNHSSQLSSSTSSISKTTPNVWIEERNTISTNTKYQNAKIFGLSSFQQKVSTLDIENNNDIDLDIDNLTSLSTEKRGKPVGKAKSFRFYSDNRNGIDDDIDNRQSMPGGNTTSTQSVAQSTTTTAITKHNLYSSTNMPSLPNLSYSEMKNCDTYKFFNKTKFNGTNNDNINNNKPPINNISHSSINNNNNNNKHNSIIIDNENTNLNNNNNNDDINNCKLNDYNNDTKFEINDMNLIKKKKDKNDNFKGITKSSSSSVIGSGNVSNITSQQLLNSKQSTILTGTPSSPVPPIKTNPISINSNITEIEDNIDKIMKSSYVTVLKKSSTIDSFEVKPSGKLNNATSNSGVNNVSITSISNNDLSAYDKILYETEENRSSSTTSSTSSIKSTRNTDINIDDKLNGNVMSTAVNASVISRKLPPAFLNIQLNRIDSNASATTKQRPKSHIILTKNMPSPTATTKDYNSLLEHKERRFSNESVEIHDKQLSSPSSSTMNSHIISPTKQSISMSDITNGNIVSMNINNKLITTKDYHQQIIKQNSLLIERRKSVSDEKLKFGKKIEELNTNKDNNNILNNRKKSTDDKIQTDENISGVVLRKKSVAQTKEDQPELMKVFARRSLKIKDDDDDYDNYNNNINNDYDTETYIANNHQLPPLNNKLTSSLSSSAVMSSNIINNNNYQSQNIDNKLIKLKSLTDSDKENQSSSEEKLDKVPKVEITIQNSKQIVNNQNDKNLLKDNDNKLQSTTIIDQIIKPTSNFITPKPYNVTPNRYSNITQSNYRNQNNANNTTTLSSNASSSSSSSSSSISTITTTSTNTTKGTSTFLDFRKNLFANSNNTILTNSVTAPTTPPPPPQSSPNTTITSTQDQNNNINNINNYNDNNNNNINLINNRHTINVMSLNDKNAKNINDINMDAEFKGILQRRAEWEKRAKGAFK